MRYYTVREKLFKEQQAIVKKCRLRAGTPEEFYKWKEETKKILRNLLAIDYRQGGPVPRVQLLETVRQEGYTKVKLLMESAEGILMPVLMLQPEGFNEGRKYPAVIALHGHVCHGKEALIGVWESQEEKHYIEQFHYAYGLELVKKGYLVFCPDALGFGERREFYSQGDGSSRIKDSCAQLNNMALPLGKTLLGMFLFDLERLMDYLETLRYVKKDKITVLGFSGGGQQALWLGALDERVFCTVDSGYFYGSGQSLLEMSNNCSCNYVPNLWQYVDMGELGALHAPQPFYIETGARDELSGRDGVNNVLTQVEVAKQAYQVLNRMDCFCHHIFEGPHQWEGKDSYDFLHKWIGG